MKLKISNQNFKEFIFQTRILTDLNTSPIRKHKILKNVKILFGNENKILFEKFESLISIN